ncbi:nephrin-like [Saccoglossus kowalevskii]
MDSLSVSRCNILTIGFIISAFSACRCSALLQVAVNNIETATESDTSTLLACTYSGVSGTPTSTIITWETTNQNTGQKIFLIQQFNGYPQQIGRYSIEEQASLRIDGPITIDDERRYTCKVSVFGVGENGPGQASVELIVNSPIQELLMEVEGQVDLVRESDMVTMIEDEPIMIICWAKQANPVASVNWYLGGQEIINGIPGFSIVSFTEEVDQPGDNRLNTASQLTFTPSFLNHQSKVLMCTGTNAVMDSELTLSVYPRVLVPPREHYIAGYNAGDAVPVIEGQVFTLSCQAEDSYPVTRLRWFRNGQEIETGLTTNNVQSEDGKVSVVSTWTYIATRAKNDDGSTIQCEASGESLKLSSTVFVTLDILYPPTDIQITGDTADFKAGMPAIGVVCSSSGGKPGARVSWWKGTTEKVTGTLNNNRLNIAMTASDNGESYTCVSSNDANIGNPLKINTAPLNVLFPPSCASLSGEGAVVANQKFTLTCSVCSSNPAASIIWKKGNSIISGSVAENIKGATYRRGEDNGEVTEQQLEITVSPSYNGVEIQCFGRNLEFSDVEVASQKVPVVVFFPPTYPEGCITSLTGYRGSLREGDSLTLMCTSCSSSPAASIRWYRDGQEIPGMNQDMLTSGLFGGKVTAQEITLTVFREHHNHDYHCSAFNNMVPNRPAPSEAVKIQVQYKPQVINTEFNRMAAANSGEETRLICQTNSNPAPQVYWFHGNRRIISDGVHFTVTMVTDDSITTSVLYINSVEPLRDYGTYNCTVNNTMGMDSTNVFLEGKSKWKPDSVTDIDVTDKSDSMMMITWTPGFNGGEQAVYYVKYRQIGQYDGDDSGWLMSLESTDPPLTIRGLYADTLYEIKVVSENSLGRTESYAIQKRTLITTVGTRSPSRDDPSQIGVAIGVAVAVLAALIVVIIITVIVCRSRTIRKPEKPSAVSSNAADRRIDQNDLSLSYFTRSMPPEPPLRTVSVTPNTLAYEVKPVMMPHRQHKNSNYEEENVYSEVPGQRELPDDDEAPPSYGNLTPPYENASPQLPHQDLRGFGEPYQNMMRDRMPTPSTSSHSPSASTSSANENLHFMPIRISDENLPKDSPYRTNSGVYV